jgi:hypothetical protein
MPFVRKSLSLTTATALVLASLSNTACKKVESEGTTAPGSFTGAPAKLEGTSGTWPELVDPPRVDGSGNRDAAIIVGLEDYATLPDVSGAETNAEDWFRHLTRAENVPLARVQLLRRQEATREGLLKAAERAANEVEPGGRLWFVYVGHGAPARGGSDGLLVGWDAVQSADSIEARSVKQSELLAILERSKGTPVVILDACFSGRTDRDASLLEGLQPVQEAALPKAQKAVVLTAARSDEYAGPLPGKRRPAFSYLLLGAMRGWGDGNGDGSVTASEAITYTNDTLRALVRDRTQTPTLAGAANEAVLARGARERGPNLTEMALTGASASEVAFDTTEVRAPTAAFEGSSTGGLSELNLEAEKAFERAMDAQESKSAPPEAKQDAWCDLAALTGSNPYKDQATTLCADWGNFTTALRDKEAAMVRDYATVRGYLELDRKSKDQKQAILTAFIGSYQDLGGGYDHLREAQKALKGLRNSGRATLPDLPPPGVSRTDYVSPGGAEVTADEYAAAVTTQTKAKAWTYTSLSLMIIGGIFVGLGASMYAKDTPTSTANLYVGLGAGSAGLGVGLLTFGLIRAKKSKKIILRYQAQQDAAAAAQGGQPTSFSRPRMTFSPSASGVTIRF